MPTVTLSAAASTAAFVGVAALVAAAVHDAIARTIPNSLPLVVLAAGLACRAAAGGLLASLLAALAVFALCILTWSRGWLGGGDVKLLAAASLLPPPALVPNFVLGTAVAGGVLALAYLALGRLVPRPAPAIARPARLLHRVLRAEAWRLSRGGPLPYAVAIAASGAATVFGG